MLTEKGLVEYLDQIKETGFTDNDYTRLKEEITERDVILRGFGDVYDTDTKASEWDFNPAKQEDYRSLYEESQARYNTLIGRYRGLMTSSHGGPEDNREPEEEKQDTDYSRLRIKNLFKVKEL